MMDWMIDTSAAVSLLIVLVLLVRRPFARIFGAKAAYALWVLPFLRLVMPEVTVPRFLPRIFQNSPPETAGPNDLVITPEILALIRPAEPSLMNQIEPYLFPSLFAIWALGVVIFFLYHWTAQASLMDRLTYSSEPASKLRTQIITAAQSAKLKRTPTVRISDQKAGPLVAGFISPTVILPDNFMSAFSPAQRHYALMHEFMHIKRGDVWVALGCLAFRAVNWPNPLVHYAAKHFRSDQEAACDASVLSAMGDKDEAVSGYAETLIHAAKTAMTSDTETGRASPQPSALALTIHHPLKERLMILGTHKKTNWRSRTAAAVMIIGAATLSAPLIQADAHPEEELAGKYEAHQGKSVIKRKVRVDGKTVSENFEINVDGDDVKAYKVGPFGKKTRIDIEEIEGVDVADVLEEKIEGDFSFNITISDDDGVKVMSRDDFKKWAETEYPEWKENDFASWANGDFKAWAEKNFAGKQVEWKKNGETRIVLKSSPGFPKPPKLPGFTKRFENIFVLESEDLKGLESLESLELLQGLEGLEALKHLKSLEGLDGLDGLDVLDGLEALKNLENIEIRSYAMDDPEHEVRLKLRMTESNLAAARSLLEDTEIEAGRELSKAKRELEKARKALKAAEQALAERAQKEAE